MEIKVLLLERAGPTSQVRTCDVATCRTYHLLNEKENAMWAGGHYLKATEETAPAHPHLIHKPFVANCYLCRVFWVFKIYADLRPLYFDIF